AAIKEYAQLAGVSPNGSKPAILPKVFPAQFSPLTIKEVTKLTTWRGYSEAFAHKLDDARVVGVYTDNGARCIAFPLRGGGCHYRKKDGTWRYTDGAKPELFVFGDIEEGANVHCFESQWDALAYADASGEENNIIATRGASNTKLIADRFK